MAETREKWRGNDGQKPYTAPNTGQDQPGNGVGSAGNKETASGLGREENPESTGEPRHRKSALRQDLRQYPQTKWLYFR